MEQNQIHLSQEQKELIEKAFRNFEKFYTPTMRNFATVIAKTVQSIYTEENIQMMQKVAIAIQKIQNQMRGFTDVINKNQAFFSELSKVTQSIHKFTDQFTEVKTQDDLINLLCNTTEILIEVNTQELNQELQPEEKEKLSIDVNFILSVISFLLTIYSTVLSYNSVSKRDLEPVIEKQTQIQEGIQKLEQISSVLVEQNKQLQAKVDRLEQNQKRNSQNNHSFDSDKQSKKSQARNQQKRQHKRKE